MPDIRLSLNAETAARVDEARGKVPRVVWIRDAIAQRLAILGLNDHLTEKHLPASLEEEGRRLASSREDLIAQGVPPTDLAVPLAPITVPEPKPSKSPPKEQPVTKTKGCAHLHTRYRMGRKHCTDCGDLL